MSILKKLVKSGLFVALAATSLAAPTQAGTPFALLVPEISVLTAQIGERIAAELKVQLTQAVGAPRPLRAARTASVVITESNAIVVEATRLPPVDALAQTDDANHAASVRVRF